MRFLVSILFVAPLAVPAFAQGAAGPWLGATASAPTRVLNAGPGVMRLGLGVGLDAVWVQATSDVISFAYHARLATAQAQGEQGGSTWNGGRVLLLDATVRAQRTVRGSATLFAGPGVSHWSGPDDAAPFSGLASVLLAAEAGVAWPIGAAGRWHTSLATRVTRVGPDDERGVLSGFVFRWMGGVQRAF